MGGVAEWLWQDNARASSGGSVGLWDGWYHDGAGGWSRPSATGLMINADGAMRVSAVFACVRLISESLAALPLLIYKVGADGSKKLATNHPLFDVLARQPNDWQTSMEFREMMQAFLLLWGNAYALIVPGDRGFAHSLEPIHPDRVRTERLEGGRIRYQVTTPGGSTAYTQDEIFHIRGMSFNGIRGLVPIDYQRESIALGLAAQEYQARFFSNDATPGGILTTPNALKPEARKNLIGSWQSTHSGLNNVKRTALLEEGVKFEAIGSTNRDAEFLGLRKFSVTDIARWFRVPPHMVADLDRATFANIEEQGQEFLTYTMLPWLVRWEQAISRDLILAPQTYIAKFNVKALTRADFEARAQANAVMFDRGVINANEWREDEDMNPREGGEEYYQQLNMVPSDNAEPAQPKPSTPDASISFSERRIRRIAQQEAMKLLTDQHQAEAV